ncbi:MAG: hypothetical protein K2F59_02460 [Eubacteriales bacterium]|nr:hypothetical protein [Eubacteriales bacterium]
MKRVRFYISDINNRNNRVEDIFEYPDGTPHKQIDTDFEKWRDRFIDMDWRIIDDEE